METLLRFINDVLGPIDTVVGLLLAIPIVWTFYDLVWGLRRKHKKWFNQARSTSGSLPAVLIVDLLTGRDIGAAVRHFMAGSETLRAIPDERFVSISRDTDLAPNDTPKLAREIQDAIGIVLRQGADELHVFLAGPVFAAAMVGAELSNVSCKVVLYQNDRASNTYVNFGPLRHPRF
jgi:hypothetical protein